MSLSPAKRQRHLALSDVTNKIDEERWKSYSPGHWFPCTPIVDIPSVPQLGPAYVIQNIHPFLPVYIKARLVDRNNVT